VKRFTETTKWQDPWFRQLSPTAKLLWLYLTDNCDHAGFIELDVASATFHIGSSIKEKHLTELASRLQQRPNGKFFIPTFIRFQYGKLSAECKPHLRVFAVLERHGVDLNQIETEMQRVSEGYPKGIHTLEEKTIQEKTREGGIRGKQKFIPPDRDEVRIFAGTIGVGQSDADWFFDKGEGNGWTNAGRPIRDWKATLRSWKAGKYLPSQKQVNFAGKPNKKTPSELEGEEIDKWYEQQKRN